jgi:hypothetical protein
VIVANVLDGRGPTIEADLRAMETMGDALAGTGKPFVGTSGTLMLVLGGLGRARRRGRHALRGRRRRARARIGHD